MPQSIKSYVRTQEIGPVIGNMILNPLLAWLGNRGMERVTLLEDHSIIVDTAITAIVASLLVTLFTASGVRRDLKAGRIAIRGNFPHTRSLLLCLPRKAWILGLVLGIGMAAVLVTLTLVVFHLLNIKEIPFRNFLVIKTVYTGILGFVVARWVILRELACSGQGSHHQS